MLFVDYCLLFMLSAIWCVVVVRCCFGCCSLRGFVGRRCAPLLALVGVRCWLMCDGCCLVLLVDWLLLFVVCWLLLLVADVDRWCLLLFVIICC